jgi:hypothetical protein
MTLDVASFRVVRNFERRGTFSKRGLGNERSIVLPWWREVGEVDCPEVTGIKSKLLVTPV